MELATKSEIDPGVRFIFWKLMNTASFPVYAARSIINDQEKASTNIWPKAVSGSAASMPVAVTVFMYKLEPRAFRKSSKEKKASPSNMPPPIFRSACLSWSAVVNLLWASSCLSPSKNTRMKVPSMMMPTKPNHRFWLKGSKKLNALSKEAFGPGFEF